MITAISLKRAPRLRCRCCFLAVALVMGISFVPSRNSAYAEQNQGEGTDLKEMGLEALMELQVSSVSKKDQRVADAAAAVFVITQEDIRRSGVTTIADALRMAPGLEVARIDSNKWAITSRGFNSRFASQMLVLFDGRVVYTPLFSGVFWDRQDTMLEDIERIEVIRGPGATLWGANAVNGVINIITKQAGDTVGGLVSAGGGTVERGFGGVRYGLALGADTTLRLYTKYNDRDNFTATNGKDGGDAWHMIRGGFRLDSEFSTQDSLTIQGDIYDGRLGESYVNMLPDNSTHNSVAPVSGGNILSRWKRSLSESSEVSLQLFYDRTEQNIAILGEKRDTLDLDLQHRFTLGNSHEIIWGLGYRFSHDTIANSTYLSITPTSQETHLFSGFVQDDITLVPDRFHFVLGSKFEHNDYTGFEVQPNARLLWTPNKNNSVWIAISRAIRTPSRAEEGVTLYTPNPQVSVPPPRIPLLVQLNGSSNLKATELLAYELGYRVEPFEHLTLDATAFYNIYHRYDVYVLDTSGKLGTIYPTPPPVHITQPVNFGSYGDVQTCGFELAVDAKPLPWWRLRTAYTFLQYVEKDAPPGTVNWNPKRENPHHQASMRSSFDVTRNVELDLWLRYVDELPAFDIASYVTLDARLAWKPLKNLELALVGQNLLHDQHKEFVAQFIGIQPTTVGRSMYGKITWTF